jgi:hypothetical protein
MFKPAFPYQYHVPDGFSDVDASFDAAITRIGSKLKGIFNGPAKIPDTVLSVRVSLMLKGATVTFKKRDELVYINFLNTEAGHFAEMFALVKESYQKYRLGEPHRPTLPIWIHSVPVGYESLREREKYICEKLTVGLLAAIYGQNRNKWNRLN